MSDRRPAFSRFLRNPALPALALLLAAAVPVHADTLAHVASPGGVLDVTLESQHEGRLAYRVERRGEAVIAPSRLGFLLGDGRLERNLELVGQSSRSFDETWEQPWGERRLTRNRYNELRASFAEKGRDRRFDVVFRVYDDGVGFRYEFPEQKAMDEARIRAELTEFALARPATAWWIPAFEWNREEYLYQRTPLSQVGTAQTPITLRTDGGLHVSIHEAALVDYAGMNLAKGDGDVLRAALTPGSGEAAVVRKLPFATPWRTLQIGERAGDLVESSLVLNLNEPNAIGDVSWFTPAKYVGVWWSLHLETETWGSGPKHGATTANTRRYIDFAADNGFRGVLVEGWNPGWDGDWFANGWGFDFTRPTPDFDLEGLAKYAAGKGVHLVGHHETACAVSHYERQLPAALELYARNGVDVVKTGYVCDAGDIQRQDHDGAPVLREWHEGQWMSNHHLRVVREAARRRIAINAHEPIKDTGLRRTYPNWVSREGARGMEFNAWGNPPNPPEHEATLVFTRMLAGPMDFTPGIVSLKGRHGLPLRSTLAKQLALYVVLYSPIQMVADLPEHYAQQPQALQFIRDVAVDWEESRVVDGQVGEYVTLARKARGSEEWFLGSVGDGHARELKAPLSFLAPGRRYRAEIYRDGDGADWEKSPFAFVRETREVGRDDTLTLRLGAGGGQAIRFVPLDSERH
ncbi:glycoside hydrolase family 97 protein [Flavobacterium sp. MXW15]|uniref:Glycoside hydrolase family 97 protein n=1 Tax=Xanthomonas chitinilytica TaxID=2989819 RepID=A0ABT3JSF4_9XANT|nr:glycoside hydrolase family 97 protein [Xanthomonas sp. H13-6]MCW4453857.1 glycoside hydrolase family 97 protein [Flavobacterium sp. MXW15]MCW4471095.1 glycoside hydrolase family 97 protein [Xanthomonas sp. H13-6]